MRRLTMQQVRDECGGVLPPDAVLVGEESSRFVPPARKGGPGTGRAARFALLNAVADFALVGLSGSEVKIWLLLFRDTKAATGTARTGQTSLARRAGVDVRTVRRALVALERRGLLLVVWRGRIGTGASVYRVIGRPP